MGDAPRDRIFVVDRDVHVRRLVQHFLAEDVAFEFFDDGYAALDRIRRVPPRVLVTEIIVPQLDGLALCRLVKGDPVTRHVPILVISTLAAADRARLSGADGFVAKPLEKKRFIASLHQLTELHARAEEPRP